MEKVFDHTNHKKMWQWLAENPSKEKDEWPEWEFNGGSIPEALNNCFACEYTKDLFFDPMGKARYVIDCEFCPLVWKEGEIEQFMCEEDNSPYLLWMDRSFQYENFSGTADERVQLFQENKALCKKIKNLPVREGVKTK